MSFEDRIRIAKAAENNFAHWLKVMNVDFARTGYENTKASNLFHAKIRFKTDITSLNTRFNPDFLVVDRSESTYFEVKACNSVVNIERKSYERLIRLINDGNNVRLVVYKDHNLFMLDNLTNAKFYVSYYDKDKVINGQWIAPRQTKGYNYDSYQSKSTGSGTEFGRLSFDNNNFYDLNQMKLKFA